MAGSKTSGLLRKNGRDGWGMSRLGALLGWPPETDVQVVVPVVGEGIIIGGCTFNQYGVVK